MISLPVSQAFTGSALIRSATRFAAVSASRALTMLTVVTFAWSFFAVEIRASSALASASLAL
jgi:formate hydrogenlyase subunit 4